METNYTLTQAGFIALTIVSFALFFRALQKAVVQTDLPEKHKRTLVPMLAIGVALWLTLISVLAARQVFFDFTTMPPKFLIVIIVPLVAIVYLTSRSATKKIVGQMPPHTILYLQSFRIIVEILLWLLFLENLIPEQMTFEGRNFDILAGIFGIVAGWIIFRKPSRMVLWVYNIAGLALLINIVTIAILSTPLPIRVFMNDPANTIVTQFPVVWLPGALVPLAYTLHILSFRQIDQVRSD